MLCIKQKRVGMRLTQEKLASLADIKRSNLSRYETGKRLPPLPIAKRLADAAFVTKALKTIRINADQEQIKAAIISARTALNLAQIAAGIKTITSSGAEATTSESQTAT